MAGVEEEEVLRWDLEVVVGVGVYIKRRRKQCPFLGLEVKNEVVHEDCV